MQTYTKIGVTDERTSCDHCGRTDLKRTVVMKDNETGEFVYFGTSCAARAANYTDASGNARRITDADLQSGEAIRAYMAMLNNDGMNNAAIAEAIINKFGNARAIAQGPSRISVATYGGNFYAIIKNDGDMGFFTSTKSGPERIV